MSRAKRWLRKQKKLNVKGMELPIYCQHCGVEASKEIYDMEKPWDYKCTMCGEYAFSDLKERIESNRSFDLGKAVEELQENTVEETTEK